MGVKPKFSIHTDRKDALKDAEFVQTTIQVGGYRPSTLIDFEIPKKFGLQQTIADTLGIGGIMRGLRTIPVLLDIAEDINEICPQAIWMQYVNPMCSNMIAINKVFPDLKSLGLCHSVKGLLKCLQEILKRISMTLIIRVQELTIWLFISNLKKRVQVKIFTQNFKD